MQIWVDADACPTVIRDILFRAADRTSTQLTLVASQFIQPAKSRFVKSVQVPKGVDSADNEIVKRCNSGDLVITSDIPLSDEVIEKGCLVLSPRGEMLTRENIKGRLNMRDFLDTLRSSGIQTGGPASLSTADRQNFGNALDKWLAQKKQAGL